MKHIVILGTSDVHGNLYGYDYTENTETPCSGLARVATYVKKVREENEAVLLLDAGDFLQGNLMLDKLCSRDPEQPHPVTAAMNYLRYDAVTLGNHDFDFGVPFQQAVLRQADFPVLAANIRNADGTLLTGKGYTVIERCGLKLAVIGVVMPFIHVTDGDKEGVRALTLESGKDAVRKMLDEIGERADIFIVSAHMDGYGEYDAENGSDSAWAIAEANPKISVLQMAHTHVADLGRKNQAVYGEVRDGAGELLRFDLYTEDDGTILRSEVDIISLRDIPPSEELRALPVLKRLHAQAVEYGKSDIREEDESPVIGYAAKTFQPKNKQKGVPIARFRETPLVQLINRVQLLESGADISACSLPNPNCNLFEGIITETSLSDIYRFPNFLVRIPLNGAELLRYLERNAECYLQQKNGEPPELNPDFPPFLQDYFSGISYEIHIGNPVGDRIRNLQFRGRPVSAEQRLTLAVSNYRLNTTLKKDGILSGEKEWESGETVRELLARYIQKHSPLIPETDGNWKIVLKGENQ